MAQALAVILPSVFGAGASVALVTATGLTLTGSLVSLAGSLALNAIVASALSPDVPQSKPQNVKLNLNEATGPRIRHYGRVQVGGIKVFYRARDGVLYSLIVHGHGLIDQLEEFRLNKSAVALDGTGNVTDDQYQHAGSSRVQLLSRFGVVPETQFAEITAIWPEFTTSHRLDGLWSTLMVAQSVPPEEFRRVYPNNAPTVVATAKTTRVVDPRSGATAYSANAALVIADLIAHPDGFNRPDLIDVISLAAAAETCDEAVALAAGGTQPRYELHGSYSLNERPQDVLKRMLDSCAGDIRLTPQGKARIHVGRYESPSVTINTSDILELNSIESGPDKLARYNELSFTYLDQELNFTEVSGQPWLNADQVLVDGETMAQAIDLSFCATHAQARRVAKVRQAQDNPGTIFAIRCKPSAVVAIYERVVALSCSEADIDALCRVKSFQLEPQSLVSTLILETIDPEAYSWSIAEEGKRQDLPPEDTSTGIPVPNIITAAAAGVQSSQAWLTAGIGVAWSAAPSDALTVLVEYSHAGQDNWVSVVASSTATQVVISGLSDGAQYDVRVAFVAPSGLVGEYAVETNVMAAADTSQPDAPTSLAVADLTGGVAEVSLVASISASLWKTEIYRDAVLVATSFAGPGQPILVTDSAGPGTFDWTSKSVNVSGVLSVDAGPVTQTIT